MVERLLKEMEKDLITLKGRLQDELNELGEQHLFFYALHNMVAHYADPHELYETGIGNSAINLALVNDSMHVDEIEGCTTTLYAAEGAPEELL